MDVWYFTIDIDVKNFALQGGADPAAELGERDNLVDEARHCRPSHCHLHHCRVGVKGFYDNAVDEDEDKDEDEDDIDQCDGKVDTRRV